VRDDTMKRWLNFLSFIVVVALCVSGFYYPYAYYTQNEMLKEQNVALQAQLNRTTVAARNILTNVANVATQTNSQPVLAEMVRLGVMAAPRQQEQKGQ
jgi:hypothetical protein